MYIFVERHDPTGNFGSYLMRLNDTDKQANPVKGTNIQRIYYLINFKEGIDALVDRDIEHFKKMSNIYHIDNVFRNRRDIHNFVVVKNMELLAECLFEMSDEDNNPMCEPNNEYLTTHVGMKISFFPTTYDSVTKETIHDPICLYNTMDDMEKVIPISALSRWVCDYLFELLHRFQFEHEADKFLRSIDYIENKKKLMVNMATSAMYKNRIDAPEERIKYSEIVHKLTGETPIIDDDGNLEMDEPLNKNNTPRSIPSEGVINSN